MARERLRHPVVDPPPLPLWRVHAAMAATLAGGPARESMQLLQPVLDSGALAAEEDSLAGTIATITMIANDQLDAARQRCEAVIEAAWPRGWLIALAHGCQLRAMALTRAGRARDAEADARLAFDYKLPVTPRPTMLYALNFLLDALIETDELAAAEAALAAAGCGNREIAEQLYITMRTVETHLTHAFQKLEITSRTELAGHMAAGAT